VTRVKICGVTSVEQATACVRLGADAIGVNLVPSSPRCIDVATARAIARAVGNMTASEAGIPRALVVAVVADLDVAAMRALREETGVGCLQLHGDEPPGAVAALLPHAYKAVRVANEGDVALAESMPGDYVMVDAKVPGLLGGSGHRLDGSLVVGLAARRRLVLAGGLDAGNVGAAVALVKPWCVDVASGVESSPGMKDLVKVKAFIEAARGTVS
jgi:phosphoribosylanthranilate isomerase